MHVTYKETEVPEIKLAAESNMNLVLLALHPAINNTYSLNKNSI